MQEDRLAVARAKEVEREPDVGAEEAVAVKGRFPGGLEAGEDEGFHGGW